LDNPYLKLLRIPNIFTVPPDVLLGCLIAISSIQISTTLTTIGYQLPNAIILILSSISLYLGGLVSNDLFDTKTDKIERPNRPLPSGKVKRKHAISLVIVFFSIGFLLSLLIFNIVTVGISSLLIVSILIYNYKLKNGYWRPFLMGGIRALNVVYGFSIIFGFSGRPVDGITLLSRDFGTNIEAQLLSLVLVSVFFHIFVLTLVSSRETTKEYDSDRKKSIDIKIILYSYIIFLLTIGVLGFYLVDYKITFIFFVVGLGIIVILIFYKSHKQMHHLEPSLRMQFIVKNMIILLILLDSAFIAGISGPLIGVATASLILPSIVLSKKISMT